jgi:hypothetical protein
MTTDVGARGRGPKVIPTLAEGELSKHGYSMSASSATRRRALAKSVREDGYKTTVGRMIALQVLFKRTRPSYSAKAIADRRWLVSRYGG